MFSPAYLDILTFFYPLGNTPAACLTRDLPRESRGDILLLGCGDVRNILFTLYSEQDTPRELDITCCDIQDAIIARNILLFSLVLADTDNANQQIIWNIYYHFYLDKSSLKVLNDQAKMLVSLSKSMSEWHETIYGRILRFCDSSTFARVRALWISFCMQDSDQERRSTFSQRLEANIQRARDVRAHYVGTRSGDVITGIRSAAPLGMAYAETARELYQHYWKYGSTSQDPDILAKTTLPNPLFACHDTDSSTLHYGTDPLLGFHLATAFAPLTKDSPFILNPTGKSSVTRVVEAARLQFRAWCNALRVASTKTLTIRFFAGDAIAFGYALHHLKVSRRDLTANIYRDAHHLSRIKLDSKEYELTKGAPLDFTVIDTSNLIDHVGSLNLLSATSPLLSNGMSCSLYTESLVNQEKDHQAYITSILCGDFPTMSLLLDIVPVEYWTNASSSYPTDEAAFDTALRLTGANSDGKMRIKLTWKRPSLFGDAKYGVEQRKLRFEEANLAHILHNVYQNMFQHENMRSLFTDLSSRTMMRRSILYYHRGSFVVFLRLVQSRVVVDWHNVMNRTLRLIEADSSIMMGLNYVQELYLYLHSFNLYSTETFLRNDIVKVPSADGVGKWKDLPGAVCITLKVPRKLLDALTGPKPTDIGTPIAHCIVQSSSKSRIGQWQNIFSAVQITFGTIMTTGTRNSNDFVINVIEDTRRWSGKCPLLVSFNVPSWFLLLEPQTAIVSFGLQSTPYSVAKFARSLGAELNVYETTLGNEEDVYITKPSPSLGGFPMVHGFGSEDREPTQLPDPQRRTTMTANMAQSDARIVSFTGHVDLISSTLKNNLRGGCTIEVIHTAPCEITIIFSESAQILLQFPLPVLGNKIKTRIARKSSYVEVDAFINASAWIDFPEFLSFRLWDKTMKGCFDLHSLNMETLPTLDRYRHSQLQWLITHTSGMFSGRERKLRDQSMHATNVSKPDARVSFKDSLFSLFMHFAGLQGEQSRVFGLDDPSSGGVQILIFVSCMKLDLGSQTVVLDTAILPLTTSLVPRIRRFLTALIEKGICTIKLDDGELKFWRQILPSFIERCRDWQHYPSCEYVTKTSQRIEDAEQTPCSCGRGLLPDGFMLDVPNWSDVAKFTTRAAISPIFSVPIVDMPFDGIPTPSTPSLASCRSCGKGDAANREKLLKCGTCQDARYCSSKCQRADWKKHKRYCKKLVERC